MVRTIDILEKSKLYKKYKDKLSLCTQDEYELLMVYSYKRQTYMRLKHNTCNNIFDVNIYKFFTIGHRCPKEKGERIANKLSKSESELEHKLFDLVQDEYKLLEVIHKKGRTYLKLKHNVCNNIFVMEQNKFFMQGQRCPNERYQRIAKSKSYTNDDFLNLVHNLSNQEYNVIGKYIDSKTKIKLKHETCGHEYEVLPAAFISGQRCPFCNGGISLTHEQFCGKVYEKYGDEYEIVSKYINSKSNIQIRHKNCGGISIVNATRLFSNICPCAHCKKTTKGEKRINDFFDHNLYNNYICQMKFNGLTGVGGGQLSYDFYLPKENILIEYQGKQHDEPIDFFGGDEQFKVQREHDKRKREYAESHNIKLLEIWYWDFDNIEDILTRELGIHFSLVS